MSVVRKVVMYENDCGKSIYISDAILFLLLYLDYIKNKKPLILACLKPAK